LIPGVHFLWFGLSAIVVGILVFGLNSGGAETLSFPWQLTLFAVISVATVFWVRRFSNAQGVESEDKDLNQRSAQYFGRVVVVEHTSSLATVYAHLASVAVAPLERVERTRPLGTVGETGRSFGPHLHFEVRFDGTAVDPFALVP